MIDDLSSERSFEADDSEQSDPLLALPPERFTSAHDLQGYTRQSAGRRMDEDPRRTARGYAAIGLVSPKTPANIGSVMRAAGCYDAALVVLGGQRPLRLAKFPTDTQRAWRHIPHICVPNVFDAIPYNCVPVAVDLIDGARDLITYTHPERAFYIFGPEDGTLGRATTSRCRDTIYVPTRFCMNLAATVNVVLYDRMSKASLRSATR